MRTLTITPIHTKPVWPHAAFRCLCKPDNFHSVLTVCTSGTTWSGQCFCSTWTHHLWKVQPVHFCFRIRSQSEKQQLMSHQLPGAAEMLLHQRRWQVSYSSVTAGEHIKLLNTLINETTEHNWCWFITLTPASSNHQFTSYSNCSRLKRKSRLICFLLNGLVSLPK